MAKSSSFKDFIIQKELGRGSFGVVYLVQQVATKELYVLKRINIGHLHIKFQQAALREVEILKTISHPNIIKYYFSYIEDNILSIVMEYAEAGDLFQLLLKHRHRKANIPEKEIWRIFAELSQAVNYLHENNIIHRDIKCQNVFLTKTLTVKLGDLGASKLVTANMQATRVGTPLYLAPEMIKQQPYDYKVDIWGLGCLMYTLAAHESPFAGSNLITLGISIINRTPKNIPMIYSKRLNSTILLLLEKNPEDRPDISQVVKMAMNKSEQDDFSAKDFRLASKKTSDYEVLDIKFMRLARPQPLPAISQCSAPFKPVIREKRIIKRSSYTDISPHKIFQNQDDKSTTDRLHRKIHKSISKKSIGEEFKFEKEDVSGTLVETRPETAAEKVEICFSRPGTAKPSLRTIIKSNTTVKINNFIPPIKSTSKMKMTVNELMNY